jgi:hypothetical protein
MSKLSIEEPMLKNPGGGGLSGAVQRFNQVLSHVEGAVKTHTTEIGDLNAVLQVPLTPTPTAL